MCLFTEPMKALATTVFCKTILLGDKSLYWCNTQVTLYFNTTKVNTVKYINLPDKKGIFS